MNSIFLKRKLIDRISIVIAPALLGGKTTPTTIDGTASHKEEDLQDIKALKLKNCEILKHSYIHLKFDVINDTRIDPKRSNLS